MTTRVVVTDADLDGLVKLLREHGRAVIGMADMIRLVARGEG